VVPAGNLKADAPPPPVDKLALAVLRTSLADRPRLLAASTHDGEETIIAEAHLELARTLPGFCTIIAPRHPHRGEAIAAQLNAMGITTARRSLNEPIGPATGVYIADTIGELGTLYVACPIAFIGGSLIERGGQNPIEAISLGSAVLTGPSTHNFRDEYAALAKAGGAIVVRSSGDIVKAVTELQSDPARMAALEAKAHKALNEMRGALGRTLPALLPLLPPACPSLCEQSFLHAS
jgi:3-deoxy-D-manno-octulosonic-acid transferase